MSFKKCAEIQDHLNKYLEEEKNLQVQLQQRKIEQEKKKPIKSGKSTGAFRKPQYLNNAAAMIRNQQLLKELEVSRARLRTLTSFTPTDQELRERIAIYRKSLAQN